MATPVFDLDADEQLRNLSKRHLENVSYFLSTLLTNNKNTSCIGANQNERRLWTYAKSRLFQLQGSKNTSEIGNKHHQQHHRQKRGSIGGKVGRKIACPKCPNPAVPALVNVKKFLRGPGKSKCLLRLSYKCDLCLSVLRRKATLFKNSKVTYDPSSKSEKAFKSNPRHRRGPSSSLLINTSSSSATKLSSDSPSLTNLNKLLLRRRSGVDAKTGLLDFLLECNKK